MLTLYMLTLYFSYISFVKYSNSDQTHDDYVGGVACIGGGELDICRGVYQLYTVKHNTSNINKNTLHWRHVSARNVAIFRPYANLERTRITALGCRRHLLSTCVIKIWVKSCS
jgi:hypothetical protein